MYQVVINPGSRSGKALKIWNKKIEPAIKAAGVEYKTHFSTLTKGLDVLATEIEKEIPEGDINCILIGGDGTLNQFIQGFEDPSRLILGLVCCGSGNDLARDLKLPKKPVKAINHVLNTGTVHPMDLGEVVFADGRKRRFVTSTGIGFDAAVCEEVDRSKIKNALNKIGLGKLIYLGIAVKNLFTIKTMDCTLTLEDEEPKHIGKTIFIAGMNHRYEGGGFKFCPGADSSDGILELCVVRNIPRIAILFILPTAFFGKHYSFRKIDAYRAKHYHISCDIPSWLHTDGEVVCQTTDFDVQCRQEAFRMIY